MKIKFYFTLFVCVILNFDMIDGKNKSISRFERVYNECKNSECSLRQQDEDCIYKCISNSCYNKVFLPSNYLLEYGEVSYEKKTEFESCFNSIKRE